MALITCKDCKKEFSTDAKCCPHCGAKKPITKKAERKFVIYTFIIISLIGVFSALNSSPSAKSKNIYTTQLLHCYRQHLIAPAIIETGVKYRDLSFINPPAACNVIREKQDNYCVAIGEEKDWVSCTASSAMLWIVVNPPEMEKALRALRHSVK